MKKKISLKYMICFILVISVIILSYGQDIPGHSEQNILAGKPLILKFQPEKAIEVSFDSIFKTVEVIDLQTTDKSKIDQIFDVVRTDSFVIVGALRNYFVFNPYGKFLRKIGNSGEGINSMKSLAYHYADNNSILSICATKWIKYGFDGSVIGKGFIPYKIYPFSFIPLKSTTWLFYIPLIYPDSDSLRLWTTDNNFRIIRRYLSYGKDSHHGGAGFMKNIHLAGNDIFITDRLIDTIYRFTDGGPIPDFVLNFSPYKVKWEVEMKELEYNEVWRSFTLVSKNSVICRVKMNNQSYLIYHDRNLKKTRTIKGFSSIEDIITPLELVGTDKNDRLYWIIKSYKTLKIDQFAKKYGFYKLLQYKMAQGSNANRFLIVTTLR